MYIVVLHDRRIVLSHIVSWVKIGSKCGCGTKIIYLKESKTMSTIDMIYLTPTFSNVAYIYVGFRH